MSRTRCYRRLLVLTGGLALAVGTALAQRQPHAGMLRYPDVSDTRIVFSYANDLWVAPREGGVAQPLASPPGPEHFPRFSPDGTTIAFVGNYEGDRDIYKIPVTGGVAERLTHHPDTEVLTEWTPDGRYLLFHSNMHHDLGRVRALSAVSVDGGLPRKLPVPYGAIASISGDGQWLAYVPYTRDHRTWKRYQGGMATDIWLFKLRDLFTAADPPESRRITDFPGTDSMPMWHDGKIYYLSDGGPNHRLNIWVFDPQTNQRRQVTNYADYDVKWPSIGPGADGRGEIVYQCGPELCLLDLRTERAKPVQITIPGDRPEIRPQVVDASEFLSDGGGASPKGKRLVVSARGDLWTLPAKHGTPRNLSRSDGVFERDPTWSPDGKWIAYFSDATGEYELYVMQSDGRESPRQITTGGETFYYNPLFSPDSRFLVFQDKVGGIFVHDIEAETTRKIDEEPRARQPRVSFSHDSNWIAYTKHGTNRQTAVWLAQLPDGDPVRVTSGMFNDTWPTFDREGKYLYLASNREFSHPSYEDVGSTFVYRDTDRLLAVPLREDVESPLLPKSDEVKPADSTDDEDGEHDTADDSESDAESDEGASGADDTGNAADDGDQAGDDEGDGDAEKAGVDDSDEDKEGAGDDDEGDAADEPLTIDLDGFERRAILLPVDRGSFTNLVVNDKGHLIYMRRGDDGPGAIKLLDISADEPEEKEVASGVRLYGVTPDGKKLVVARGGKLGLIKAAPKQAVKDMVVMSPMRVRIDPRAEWNQIFHDAWRIMRGFFYDPHMHGVDWPAVRQRYAAMLDDAVSRDDVAFIIGEMIGELNVGHAYVWSAGDTEDEPSTSVGMLGCDFELVDGAFRISRIIEGGPWDVDARGPLSQPGVDVEEGDYLLAVNGVALDVEQDPWAAMQGLAGQTVTLTVNKAPEWDDEAREVVVELMSSESSLRYRAWVERNRRYVDEATDGAIGYIHVPDTGVNGQNNLFRQFYGQRDKAALIIDERWNGGGQIPTRFVELLNRPLANYWAVRDGRDWITPPDAHFGPKCMLINGLAGSGGDYFPWWFRRAGVGKLIGTRTWGGLVGISGNPGLIDGGYVTVPTFAFYEPDGTWGIEGYGVAPDIEVVDDPAKMVGGRDPQLDAAIAHLREEIQRNGYHKPDRPAYPDRSGMGITDADR